METKDVKFGVVTCLRLHIFAEPNTESEIVHKARYLTEVEIDMAASTEEFYKICTPIGAEGFCIKEHIVLKK